MAISHSRVWRCANFELPVFDRVHVMGVVNVTPDSFSDGGRFLDHSAAIAHAMTLVDDGADIVDIGGESTRPGAESVTAEEELARVLPVIKQVASEGAAVSVDTTKAEVAAAALDAGAAIVNDVSAFRFDPKIAAVAAEAKAGVVLMHMKGEPRTMQKDPHYDDVVAEVRKELLDQADKALASGIGREAIALDPGFGFGKTREHNLQLLRWNTTLVDDGYPVVVGPSRKSFIGLTLDLPVEERVEGTAAVVAWLVATGAHVVRVHDVKEMVRVVRMTEAIKKA
ncbi:MAG TPA: dihydropteroate synthase [Actinomycetota bacterium]|nr:dihydropteroate synthase [Actinomycetota bacterium]